MVFEILMQAHKRGELILMDGGFCHWHLKKDGGITIHEIISQKRGVGQMMLDELKATPGGTHITAKCPQDLPSNEWYKKRGFDLIGVEHTRSGRGMNVWRLAL